MSIPIWPNEEKPREKLLNQGASSLSNAELLAVILGSGSQERDVLGLSRDLLNHYNGLHKLFCADFASLTAHNGIGKAKYCQLKACAELNRRHLREPLQQEQAFIDSLTVKHYLTAELRNLTHEVFGCLFFDIRFRLIRFEVLFSGTLSHTAVHPRILTKRALELNAAKVIVTHNHPSGDVTPSDADLELTKHLNQALNLVEIDLIDHIIVGGAKTLSFSEHGLMAY